MNPAFPAQLGDLGPATRLCPSVEWTSQWPLTLGAMFVLSMWMTVWRVEIPVNIHVTATTMTHTQSITVSEQPGVCQTGWRS